MSTTTIRIFVTGGTFDKEYNEIEGKLLFKDTHLPQMLKLGRSRVKVEVRTLMMIDSLEMTDADREIILENCLKASEDRILITHGTDTMVETARVLGRAVSGKTILLTGAMVPFAFGSSDGLFNLGSALAFVQTLAPGVYLAMTAAIFPGTGCARTERPASSKKPLKAAPQNPQGVGGSLAALIGVTSFPMPSISMETTSPGLRNSGGFRAAPTPSGVPVETTSPG